MKRTVILTSSLLILHSLLASPFAPEPAGDEWMPYFETTNTIVRAESQGVTNEFAAPEFAYRLIHYGSTNLTHVTHIVTNFDGCVCTRGEAVRNMAGWKVTGVWPSRRVAVVGRDVCLERGFESEPPSRGTVRSDSDGDGIPDGWEIYVGSDPLDPSDATSDWDGDGLSLAEEYNHGYFPTDPRSADTDGDGVIDRYAFAYHLKGEDSSKDPDGDGLTNYEEYLASEVFSFCKLDPDDKFTSDVCIDGYRKVGELYLREVFGRYAADPDPERKFEARIDGNGEGMIDVFAWNTDLDRSMTGRPDVMLSVSGESPALTNIDVKPGSYTVVCRQSPAGDGKPAKLGIATDVSSGGSLVFSAAMSEHSPITPRIDLWADTSDRGVTVGDINAQLLNNELNHVSETNIEDFINARIDTSRPPEAGKTAHVRVVRYAIDDLFCYTAGVGSEIDGYDQIVVMDKTFDPSGRSYLCEADFLADGKFDIDWDTLTGSGNEWRTKGAIVDVDGNALGNNTTGPKGASLGVTNMSYLVVIGDGPKDFRFKYDTNTVRALATVVTRRFEKTRSQPVADGTHKIFYSARPTFTWSMPTEEAWAKEFGSSYTAFRLQVFEESKPTEVVYDSGIVRAPRTDADGNFVWTAPICAGSLTPQGKIFAANASYKWHVSMYNAKFRSDYWSSSVTIGAKPYGAFTMVCGNQQNVNDHGCSLVKVAVKYTGSSNVLEKCATLSEPKGKVRVQAFATADFSGEPLAEAVVTNKLDDVTVTTDNATLVGLSVGSAYYIRAYIDMNGNGRKDDWESWGAVKDSVALKTTDRTAQTVGLYIEDANTDHDCLPDAWEYAVAGWTGDFADIRNELYAIPSAYGTVAVTAALAEALVSNKLDAAISSGLPDVSLTTLGSPDFAEALLGLTETASIDAIRANVEAKITPNSLKITSLTIAGHKIVLTVDADVAYEIAGMPLNKIYDLSPYASVTLRIWKKNTLLDANWTKVGEDITVTFNKGIETVYVDTALSGDRRVDLTSGLYKVEIV